MLRSAKDVSSLRVPSLSCGRVCEPDQYLLLAPTGGSPERIRMSATNLRPSGSCCQHSINTSADGRAGYKWEGSLGSRFLFLKPQHAGRRGVLDLQPRLA